MDSPAHSDEHWVHGNDRCFLSALTVFAAARLRLSIFSTWTIRVLCAVTTAKLSGITHSHTSHIHTHTLCLSVCLSLCVYYICRPEIRNAHCEIKHHCVLNSAQSIRNQQDADRGRPLSASLHGNYSPVSFRPQVWARERLRIICVASTRQWKCRLEYGQTNSTTCSPCP